MATEVLTGPKTAELLGAQEHQNNNCRREDRMGQEILTGPRAAKMLGVQEQTLRAWRVRGAGPDFVRYGGPKGRVRYTLDAIEAWIASRTFSSTSEEVATLKTGTTSRCPAAKRDKE